MSTEQLVVRSWGLPADNSRITIRSHLLTIRGLQLRQIILLADKATVVEVLDEVSIVVGARSLSMRRFHEETANHNQ